MCCALQYRLFPCTTCIMTWCRYMHNDVYATARVIYHISLIDLTHHNLSCFVSIWRTLPGRKAGVMMSFPDPIFSCVSRSCWLSDVRVTALKAFFCHFLANTLALTAASQVTVCWPLKWPKLSQFRLSNTFFMSSVTRLSASLSSSCLPLVNAILQAAISGSM